MLETLELVVLQFLILSAVGLAALAPVKWKVRRKLLPAAPVFGAALIAVITSWTCRWLSIKESLPIIAIIAVFLLLLGARRQRRPLRMSRGVLTGVALGVAGSIAGLVMAAAPVAAVHDTDAVAPTYIVDQFYFAGVSTYLVDHPVLPGPVMKDQWVGNDPPATAPAADTVANRLRFGQSAVAAVLSVLVFHTPYTTVVAVGLLWLVLLGLVVVTCGSLLGLTRRAAWGAAVLVTGSFFVVAQPLQGQNDGLLGTSIFLLALTLSIELMRTARSSWPLVLVGAGLAATYSEYLSLLGPALGLAVVLGPRASFLRRLNAVSGHAAAAVCLAPWAFIWLAESFRIASRFTNGPQPFANRSGWELLRAYLGITTVPSHALWNTALSVIAVVALAVAGIGWYAALRQHRARGALAGLLVTAIALETAAVLHHAGNLQYRVLQLSIPPLLLLAVAGWDIRLRSSRSQGRHSAGIASRSLLAGGAAALVGILFVAANLTTCALTVSFERARTQHIPATFIARLTAFVDRVGGDKVTVVAPTLTDESALSLALTNERDVDYAVILPSPVYVGPTPHWDANPNAFYVVGPGATVVGDADYLIRDGDYAVVHLRAAGMIVSPWYTGGWPRVTWMRGFLCARDWSPLLVIRGSTQPATLTIASQGATTPPPGIRLMDSWKRQIPQTGHPARSGDWTIQSFPAPRAMTALVGIRPIQRLHGPAAVPVAAGGSAWDQPPASQGTTLTDACFRGDDSGMDGYDRELTFMRTAP